MLSRALLLGLSQQAAGQGPPPRGHGYKTSEPWLPRERVGPAAAAEMLVAEAALPANFDYRDVNGKNLVVEDWNQHLPAYCGACWIHGTLAALNDRIKIMRDGAYPDVRLGRQSVMNCVPDPKGQGPPPGCDGGDAGMIHKYMYETKVPDETCMPYQGYNMGCTTDTVCRNCAKGALGCWGVPDFIGYGVSSYGFVSGEEAMMKEIFARGPIACTFATDDAWMFNYSENVVHHEGVYVTTQKKTVDQVDHLMEIAGWGETPSGRKYWVIRNTWGTYWGEAGWAKLERGVNALFGERDCAWAVPTWEGLDEALAGRTLGSYRMGQEPPATYGAPADWAEVEADRQPATSTPLLAAALGAFVAGAAAALAAVRIARGRRVRQAPLLLG